MGKVLMEITMSLDGYTREPLRGLRPRKVDTVSATVLDTSMSPRSKRPPTEEAR